MISLHLLIPNARSSCDQFLSFRITFISQSIAVNLNVIGFFCVIDLLEMLCPGSMRWPSHTSHFGQNSVCFDMAYGQKIELQLCREMHNCTSFGCIRLSACCWVRGIVLACLTWLAGNENPFFKRNNKFLVLTQCLFAGFYFAWTRGWNSGIPSLERL